MKMGGLRILGSRFRRGSAGLVFSLGGLLLPKSICDFLFGFLFLFSLLKCITYIIYINDNKHKNISNLI